MVFTRRNATEFQAPIVDASRSCPGLADAESVSVRKSQPSLVSNEPKRKAMVSYHIYIYIIYIYIYILYD